MSAISSGSRQPAGRVALPSVPYWIWRRLTSVRWAIGLILGAALFSAAGVIIPQVPPQLIGIPGQIEAHIDLQRGTWGWATDPLAEFPWFYDANGGIFNLYQQPYWYALIALVAVAIAVCTVSRCGADLANGAAAAAARQRCVLRAGAAPLLARPGGAAAACGERRGGDRGAAPPPLPR